MRREEVIVGHTASIMQLCLISCMDNIENVFILFVQPCPRKWHELSTRGLYFSSFLFQHGGGFFPTELSTLSYPRSSICSLPLYIMFLPTYLSIKYNWSYLLVCSFRLSYTILVLELGKGVVATVLNLCFDPLLN
jgi:hypothetical protein